MDWTPFLQLIGVFVTAVGTAVAALYATRSRAKTQVNSVITNGFQALTEKLQQERQTLIDISDRQNERIAKQSDLIERMERKIRRMDRHIEALERIVEVAGMPLPPRAIDSA